ncbi:MAG: hypothetical protein QXP36_03040 [Conexivisphaerales archaeon]
MRNIYYIFMITQDQYEEFRDSITTLMEEYRNKFSIPVITNWKEYEATHRNRMLGMSRDLRSVIDHASNIVADEFGRPSLLDAKEKVLILLSKEITRIFIIPRRNSRIRGRKGWREIIRVFVEDPTAYLRESFRRSNSKAGFSADKRTPGQMISQKRSDRIETSGFCKGLLRNTTLMNG